MNKVKVQEAIDNIIREQRAGGIKSVRVAQKTVSAIEDLGLSEFVPEWMLDIYANAIVIEAKKNGSQLYKAMWENAR